MRRSRGVPEKERYSDTSGAIFVQTLALENATHDGQTTVTTIVALPPLLIADCRPGLFLVGPHGLRVRRVSLARSAVAPRLLFRRSVCCSSPIRFSSSALSIEISCWICFRSAAETSVLSMYSSLRFKEAATALRCSCVWASLERSSLRCCETRATVAS